MYRDRIFCVILLVFCAPSLVWAQDVSFSQVKGLQTEYLSTISSCALNPGTGHLVVCGHFAKTLEFDAGMDSLETQGAATDVFVMTMDSQDQVVWAVQDGGDNLDHAEQVAVDAQGDIYMTGRFLDQTTFGHAGENEQPLKGKLSENIAFVSKYASNGSLQWAKAINGPDMSSGFDVCVDSADGVYAAGAFVGSSLFPGDRTMSNNLDGYLVRLNAQTGDPEWQIPLGGDGADQATAVDIGSNNRVYVAGLQGNILFLQARDMQSGVQISEFSEIQTHLGSSAHPPDIAVGSDGRVYVTGSFTGDQTFGDVQLSSHGGTDIFVAGYTGEGKQLFATSVGSPGNDVGRALTVDDAGLLRVVGEVNGTVQWNDREFGQAGSTEAVVIFCGSNDGRIVEIESSTGKSGAKRSARDIVSKNGKGYLVGEFEDNLSLGDHEITSEASNKAGFWVVMDRLAPRLGDVDGDYFLDFADAILALQATIGSVVSNNSLSKNADVNGDEKIGLPEAVYVLQHMLH